ncbi:hypothetical protein DH2020_037490 [Rehmannia glutinosa]|uniref:hAT-like transposase RNase-H fold domain-containing protein n=1 Tax=Rehmannia glutinosa TaxID=99300 RepID=A0ABR0V1D1_REHGL
MVEEPRRNEGVRLCKESHRCKHSKEFKRLLIGRAFVHIVKGNLYPYLLEGKYQQRKYLGSDWIMWGNYMRGISTDDAKLCMESTRGDTTGSRTRNPDLCPPLSTSLDEMETNENEMEDLETTKEGQSERPKKIRNGGAHGDIGLPTKYDWIVVEKFVTVLRYFYELTLRVSGSLFVTSNTFLDEIHEVNEHLNNWLKSDDDDLVDMTSRMKSKFDKYWGSIEKFNMMLYIGFMLDPRHKFGFLQYYLKNMYGSERGDQVSKLARNVLYEVFAEYKKMYSSVTSSTSLPSSTLNVGQESGSRRDPTNAIDKKMRIQELITGIGASSHLKISLIWSYPHYWRLTFGLLDLSFGLE